MEDRTLSTVEKMLGGERRNHPECVGHLTESALRRAQENQVTATLAFESGSSPTLE